ncbi:hypothetical protein [Rossellomorea sp. LJF3]|uniref:hypothetical protein n=1 Tax=Rossellomorea sp. LJF3 TaxID=3126099 RepID=UPI00300D23E7
MGISNHTVNCICITADVIDSRINRKESDLQEIVNILKVKYDKSSVTKFSKRFGDEIFGILTEFGDAYWALKDLYRLSSKKEIPLYVGVGIGSIGNENSESPHDVNGNAVWNSSDALKLLKKDDKNIKHFRNDKSSFKYFIKADDEYKNYMILNYMINFIFEKISKRTPKQTEIIEKIEENPELNLEEVGIQLGYDKNPSTNVSKMLMRAEYHLVNGAELELVSFLKNLQVYKE